ncbi:MAG: N-acetylneuraminate synthase family protein, partial [Promethearchaeota archaeon]
LSTGMHSIEEIDRAIEILKNDDAEYVLMQCTSIYPLKERDVNLWILKMYSERYNCEVGYSGHDTGVIAPAISAVLGALVIEKHVTLDRAMKGPDHAASLENRGLDLTIKYIKSGLEMLGSKDKKILNEEFRSREKYCFSVRAQHDIKEGEDFTEENITLKSPKVENGRDYYELLGQKAEKNYKKDDLIL